MKVSFTTKAESNRAQEQEFLKLSGEERVDAFFRLVYRLRDFPSTAKSEGSDNFVIEIGSKE